MWLCRRWNSEMGAQRSTRSFIKINQPPNSEYSLGSHINGEVVVNVDTLCKIKIAALCRIRVRVVCFSLICLIVPLPLRFLWYWGFKFTYIEVLRASGVRTPCLATLYVKESMNFPWRWQPDLVRSSGTSKNTAAAHHFGYQVFWLIFHLVIDLENVEFKTSVRGFGNLVTSSTKASGYLPWLSSVALFVHVAALPMPIYQLYISSSGSNFNPSSDVRGSRLHTSCLLRTSNPMFRSSSRWFPTPMDSIGR